MEVTTDSMGYPQQMTTNRLKKKEGVSEETKNSVKRIRASIELQHIKLSQDSSMQEVFEAMMEYKKGFIKYGTIRSYYFIFRRIEREFPQLIPNGISPEDLQEWVLSSIERGYSARYTRDTLNVIRQLLVFARERGIFCKTESDPTRWDIHYPKASLQSTKIETMSDSDTRKLKSYVEEHPKREHVCIYLSLCLGLRVGEACGLRWCDVDLKEGVISISHSVSRHTGIGQKGAYLPEMLKRHFSDEIVGADPDTAYQGGAVSTLSTTKTINGVREIPLTPTIVRYLRQWRERNQDPLAFVSTGTYVPMSSSRCRNLLTSLLRKLRIPRIKYHGLRHTFATRCVSAGVDIKTLSCILGHAKVEITMNLYVHPTLEQKKREVRKALRRIE